MRELLESILIGVVTFLVLLLVTWPVRAYEANLIASDGATFEEGKNVGAWITLIVLGTLWAVGRLSAWRCRAAERRRELEELRHASEERRNAGR